MKRATSVSAGIEPVLPADIVNPSPRAREDVAEGAVTAGHTADRAVVLTLLNEALATELVCVLRYKCHYFRAEGVHSAAVTAEFLAHAAGEMAHADRLAKRICELGGRPNFSPDGLSERSYAEYVEGDSLHAMLLEDLVAERIAIEGYRETIAYLGTHDSTTRDMLEDILAMEEEHADAFAALLENMPA